MSFRVHALDRINVFLSLVNLTFVDVVASDKERSLRVVALKQIKDVIGVVLVRAIVESECD